MSHNVAEDVDVAVWVGPIVGSDCSLNGVDQVR